jgi:hypothetical protein
MIDSLDQFSRLFSRRGIGRSLVLDQEVFSRSFQNRKDRLKSIHHGRDVPSQFLFAPEGESPDEIRFQGIR